MFLLLDHEDEPLFLKQCATCRNLFEVEMFGHPCLTFHCLDCEWDYIQNYGKGEFE